MHANVHTDRAGGGGGSWRLPPDETLQVADPKQKEEQDLFAPEGHNWKSIVFSLLVIGFVISGIITAIYLLGYVDELLYWSGRRMKLHEFLQKDVIPQRLPSTWINSKQFVFQSDDGGLAVLDTATNFVSTLVTNHTLRQINVKGYQCSYNLRYVLFKHNVKQVYRLSFTSLYTVYDVENDHHMPIRLKDSPKIQRTRLQYVSWIGNTTAIAIVADNDIYIRQSPSDEEDHRLTFTGQENTIYNGVPDWLYQEEIFTTLEAMWFSEDGTHMMYASFNDTRVGHMTFPWFASNTILAAGRGDSRTPFPISKQIRYPTAGSIIPDVTLWVVDISNISNIRTSELVRPAALEGQDHYFLSASWVGAPNSQISTVWITRSQNLSFVATCYSPSWKCLEHHSERAPENEWLDILPHPIFAPDGDSFLMMAGIQETGTEHFTHIKHVTITQQRIAVISHGRYEVVRILAWDTYNHLVYYLGTHEKRPGQQHLYVVKDPVYDELKRSEPSCITCDLSEVLWSSRYYYSNCTHFDAYMSPPPHMASISGITHYVLECKGPGLPLAVVHSTFNHRLVKVLFDTRPVYTSKLQELALPTQRSFEIPLPHGTRAAVQLLLPPSWREELRDAAFPVLVEVNGRPGSTAVSEEFKIDWGTYMSSHNDVVYVRLDVRGARGQGKKALYRHIGGVEVQDQIAVLRHLLDTLKFLDENRVGVWGWGYGGYVTAMILGSQQTVFKCGISVSPITDWLYYNSVFTERILGVPTENYKAYVEADATQKGKQIPSNSYLLLHGLADVSAPYQHGIQLARSLSESGIIYRYQIPPRTYKKRGERPHPQFVFRTRTEWRPTSSERRK
ncbi:inactive dipeptidyl peptidase 10 isoform X2 [Toxorhynchites rutilus septentrionalis]|uniref:inactive dipeptidyl peptidase 10 isoform X2 n=1 Tax=Toxorhynchites rutilus septentrionalis TaxID=329112 RepID=UPI002479D988|nr:inactive dipeptidyl peptidase 10 isoform X2 [Toxorhynchites rutilus septentrionalis]